MAGAFRGLRVWVVLALLVGSGGLAIATSAPAHAVSGVPDSPSGVVATPGNQHVMLSWTPPAHDGGSPITSYTVTRTPDGRTDIVDKTAVAFNWTGLTNGVSYKFTVHATNANGDSPESSPSTAVPDDGLPPVVALTAPTGTVRLTTQVPVAWTASDASGIGHYDVRRAVAPWNGPLAPYASYLSATTAKSATYAGTYGHTYCFSARAQDKAGHVSAYTAPRCNAVPLRSDQFARGSSWTKATNSAYFGGFAFKSVTKGAVLTRTGVVAKKLYLVVTKCATCGVVQVKWRGTVVANVNLHNATTLRRQVVRVVAAATATTGTLSVTIASLTGKLVIVEGLGVLNGL